MKLSKVAILSLAVFSTSVLAEGWQTFSVGKGTKSTTVSTDSFSDVFPFTIGATLHKFDTDIGSKPDMAADIHFGVGWPAMYATIGLGGVRNKLDGDTDFIVPISLTGGFLLDENRQFILAPYIAGMVLNGDQEVEVGLKFSYSPRTIPKF